MPTVTIAVAAANDDAYERGDNTSFTNSAGGINCNGDTGSANFAFTGGFRFQNVLVPQAAEITAATISFVPSSSASDDPSVDIFLENVDNSADFATTADVVSRTKTTASTSWSASNVGADPTRVTSPSIVTAVQEVVNRAGWASGNAMTVLVRGKPSGNNFTVRAYEDGDTSETAVLSITYLGGGGTGTGGKGKGGGKPVAGDPPKKGLKTSIGSGWRWDRRTWA